MSVHGTKVFMAPEVVLRTGYSKLADMWSLGVTFYASLVNQSPFPVHDVEKWKKCIWNFSPSFNGISECAKSLVRQKFFFF